MPKLSTSHYHYNTSDDSARDHAIAVRNSIKDQPNMFLEAEYSENYLYPTGISAKGRDFIHSYETFSEKTYGDAGGGRGTLTIGYGATYYLEGTVITRDGEELVIEDDGQKPRMGDTMTEPEADRLSKQTIEQEYLRPVVAALEKNGLMATQQQLDALVSYSYHRGGSNAAKLVGRLRELADAEHSNDGLAIRAAFMFDINSGNMRRRVYLLR
jgi:GH24 family phage-related lysozyme (muramidase)